MAVASGTAGAYAVSTAYSSFDAVSLGRDLTCNCPQAQAAAEAVAEAITQAGGCDCDAGRALAAAVSQATSSQADAISKALARMPSAQQCLRP